MTPNAERFRALLADAYRDLFATDLDYAYVAKQMTPGDLATKMTLGLSTGRANKDGRAIPRVCKQLGIKCTYTAIRHYLGNATASTEDRKSATL